MLFALLNPMKFKTINELAIDNYQILRLNRNRHGGGVVMYIHSSLSYQVCQLEHLECLLCLSLHYNIMVNFASAFFIVLPLLMLRFLSPFVQHYSLHLFFTSSCAICTNSETQETQAWTRMYSELVKQHCYTTLIRQA